MKLLNGHVLVAVAALAALAGCASIGPPTPPSLELPKPPSDLRAQRKGDNVTLTWTIPARTTDRQSIRYLGQTNICRSLDQGVKQCGSPIGEVAPPADFADLRKSSPQKLTAAFYDSLPEAMQAKHPKGFAVYAVEVLNTANRSAGLSNKAEVPLIPTLSPFSGFTAQTQARGVMISWQCSPTPDTAKAATKYLFRIYRRQEGDGPYTRIAEVDATTCATGSREGSVPSHSHSATVPIEDQSVSSFLDQTLEWEKTYSYRGTVVSVMEAAGKPAIEVEGDDTPEVKVFAHDIFPPTVPMDLQAVYSGSGQRPFIDLIWAPAADADLAGYNVYRHQQGAAAVKLNSELVMTPAFRDVEVQSGKTYFYSVSAVDQRGNQSGRSEEASESVP